MSKVGFCGFHVPGTDEKSVFRLNNHQNLASLLGSKFIELETQTIFFPSLNSLSGFLNTHPDFILLESRSVEPFTIGEIGIWASWYTALLSFIQSDLDWLIVYEDDLWLGGLESVAFIEKILQDFLPTDSDFLALSVLEGEFFLHKEDQVINQYLSERFQTCCLGLSAISKKAARRILEKIKSGIDDRIDFFLFSDEFGLKTYSLIPTQQVNAQISLYNQKWIGSTIYLCETNNPVYVPYPLIPLKLAVHLHGHLRTFRDCAPYLKKHLLSLYDCDVFIHTWDVTEHSTQTWYDSAVKAEPMPVDDSVKQEIREFYNPKSLIVEHQGEISEDGFFGTDDYRQVSMQGIRNSLYSMRRSVELSEDFIKNRGVVYDFSIVVRPDIMLHEDFDVNKYSAEFHFFNSTSIHLVNYPQIRLRERKFLHFPLAFDVFFFAKYATIKKISEIEKAFSRYYRDISNTLPKGVEAPELGLHQYLAEHTIVPKEYQFYYTIKRKNAEHDITYKPAK